MTNEQRLLSIRRWLIFFITALVISGLTAIPLKWELNILANLIQNINFFNQLPLLKDWIEIVRNGLTTTYDSYPFMGYGNDWLAFAHLMIAVAFIGPLKDPIRNKWIIQFGMIACIAIIPWTLFFGAVRSIPWFWQMIDCSFGVFGFIPLWIIHNHIQHIESDAKASII